jgi:hypothetical protein
MRTGTEIAARPEPQAGSPRPFGAQEPFAFACTPGIACFNDCCRDLNQFLTPYDALRLARGMGLAPGDFLARFTRRHAGPGSGLPVVTLVPGDPPGFACPFVTAAGCRVYPDRPSSCRTYPLMRVARRCRATGAISAEFLLLREPHCRGFGGGRAQTARDWEAAQGLADYNAENDRLLEVISLKNRLRPGPLPPDLFEKVYTAFYALDGFRGQLRDARLEGVAALAPQTVEAALGNDLTLLRLGVEWVKGLLKGTAAD